jgi:hypothetical protein
MRSAKILFIFLAWMSCEEKAKEPIQVSGLTYRLDSLVEQRCVGANCASLSLRWPVIEGGEQADRINLMIRESLESMIQIGEELLPLDSARKNYFRSFEEFKAEFPDSHGGWEIEVDAQVTYQSDSTLSIVFPWMSFLGGAHPNHGKSYMNFDVSTGDYLSSDRLILDEAGLLALAQQKFRQFHHVKEGLCLEEDGRFFLPETGFFLANAMGFQEGKFWVVYIPYEIGPYAMGYTELEFSKAELPKMVRW